MIDGIAESEAEAKREAVSCQYCDLTGLVTIFHHLYTGMPTVEITNHNGETRTIPGRICAHCICPVGRWIRFGGQYVGEGQRRRFVRFTPEDVIRRVPDLHEVLTKKIRWTVKDSTLPEVDPNEVPDWKAVRRWLASLGLNGAVKTVKPEYAGNRNQARREMGVTTVEGR